MKYFRFELIEVPFKSFFRWLAKLLPISANATPDSRAPIEPETEGGDPNQESVVSNDTPQSTPEPPRGPGPGGPESNTGDLISPEHTQNAESKPENTKPPSKAGRRRDGRKEKTGASSPQASSKPRPELICRRNAGDALWEVVVVAKAEMESVVQENRSLPVGNGEYPLQSFAASLHVSQKDGQTLVIPLIDGDQHVMIFKFPANWSGKGQKVNRVTKGRYIIIAPKEFRQTGYVLHESEPCRDDCYCAYYFYISDESQKAAEPVGFEEHTLATDEVYRLEGKSLFDNSENGPLFVETAPKLELLAQDIVWARVGEERIDGWKGKNFKPKEKTIKQILKSRQGRFFLRVYNSKGMIDSGEFRYLRCLREIRVTGETFTSPRIMLPGPDGHGSATVCFVGDCGVVLNSRLVRESSHIMVRDSIVVVNPHPDGDRVECRLSAGDGEVEVVLDLPRVWWRLKSNDDSVQEWRDTPICVTRKQFRDLVQSNSDAVIWLKLPKRIEAVEVGFDEEADRRRYRRNGSDKDGIGVRLLDFLDYEQVSGRPYNRAELNAIFDDSKFAFLTLVADPLPAITSFAVDQGTILTGETVTLHWSTRHALPGGVAIKPGVGPVEPNGTVEVTPAARTTYTLRLKVVGRVDITESVTVNVALESREDSPSALVKCIYGWRCGKGFSRGELKQAGSNPNRRTWDVPFDKRRRSIHQQNVEIIQELSNA